MSRTRLIRPAFFFDERMARLSAWTRLVYIGLWTLADDAGFFEYKPSEIAVALLSYERPSRRKKLVDDALLALTSEDRIRQLQCGVHGLIPTLPEYMAQGGRHTFAFQADHRSRCELTLFSERGRTRTYASSPVLGSGSGSGSESGRPAGRVVDNPLREASLAAGGFAGRLAATKP